jgi:starvation-inducible DNA-binding protein
MLADALKTLLGSTHVLYTKIHGFHWNVEGKDFPQYHKFLNKFYEEVYETIDTIGEYIRTLDSFAPGSLTRFMELTIIKEQLLVPRAELMMSELLEDSEKMIEMVKDIFDVATENREQAIANYMADLQELYAKKAWMLRSILKTSRA